MGVSQSPDSAFVGGCGGFADLGNWGFEDLARRRIMDGRRKEGICDCSGEEKSYNLLFGRVELS